MAEQSCQETVERHVSAKPLEIDSLLEAELTLSAWCLALRQGCPAPGLVHHSDRGIQYTSKLCTDVLREHQIQISMSRQGNPWDNAACESLLKTLKYEEVYRTSRHNFPRKRA